MRGNKSGSVVPISGTDAPMVDDEPPVLIYCMMCRYWNPGPPARLPPPAALVTHSAFGHCLLSAKALSAPMPTTDLSTCSMAEMKT